MARKARETAQTEEIVTEIQDTENVNPDSVENPEPEAGTADGGHKFNIGDTASVVRGKLRGQTGEIISYDKAGDQYAVKLESGSLAVLNGGNLKAPKDSTISVRALVSALAGFGQEAGTADRDAAVRLATMLDEVAPGTSVKLNEAFSV